MENKRIWEIDLLRAIAIILMVIFHLVYDLNEFMGININYQSGFWFWVGKASALTFIFLAGISSGFSRNSAKRGIKVLIYAMGITLISYIIFKEQYVRFGILHLLGISMIIFPALKKVSNFLLFISAAVIALAAIPLENITTGTSLLLPFGVMYPGFVTIDYYPLIPYLSVFIMGILAYKLYYFKNQRLFRFSYQNEATSFISKNSLKIYLIHQPVIIGTIFVLNFLTNR